MRRTIVIVGGIALVCILLVARLLFRQNSGMTTEREWFAKSLRYEFSARVDSIKMFNQHTGKLLCRVTAGHPQAHREDSLKTLFKQHDMLYLIFHQAADSIIFIVPNANQVSPGDSVRVSSKHNTIEFFRAGQAEATISLSDALTGYSRPFFMKEK